MKLEFCNGNLCSFVSPTTKSSLQSKCKLCKFFYINICCFIAAWNNSNPTQLMSHVTRRRYVGSVFRTVEYIVSRYPHDGSCIAILLTPEYCYRHRRYFYVGVSLSLLAILFSAVSLSIITTLFKSIVNNPGFTSQVGTTIHPQFNFLCLCSNCSGYFWVRSISYSLHRGIQWADCTRVQSCPRSEVSGIDSSISPAGLKVFSITPKLEICKLQYKSYAILTEKLRQWH